MTIDLSDLRAFVRDEDELVFTDDALEAGILAAGGSMLRAAGSLFRTLAAEYVLKGRSIKTDDLAIDTRNRGKDLNEVATSFFNDAVAADASAGADFFEIVPFGGRLSPSPVRPEATPFQVSCCVSAACERCVL